MDILDDMGVNYQQKFFLSELLLYSLVDFTKYNMFLDQHLCWLYFN